MNARPLPQSPRSLILIDGYGFVFRAYHAMAKARMTSPNGTPVGAVYAFTNMLLKVIKDHESDYIAVVFDAGAKTFRNDLYPAYKANRPPAPDDLIPQFPLVREAAKALNLAIVEQKGYEADDLIATYTRIARAGGHEVMVISSDKDLMQLVGDGVTMYDPLKSRHIGPAEVTEKFGVAPDKVLDILALMGDSSDNIPGVPGIGPKTAAELINRFGDLDAVLANTAEIKQDKRRQSLEENRDKALLSRDLVRLCEEVPVSQAIEEFVVTAAEPAALLVFLKEQGFKSIISKMENVFSGHISDNAAARPSADATQKELIFDINSAKQWLDKCGEIKTIALHVERNKKTGAAIGAALSVGARSCYLPFVELAPVQTSLFGDAPEEAASKSAGIEAFLQALKSVSEDASTLKIGHDLKVLIKTLKDTDATIKIAPIDDIMLMSYSLEAGLHKHDLENMILRHHNDQTDRLMEVKTLVGLAPEKAMEYACIRSEAILAMHKELKQRLFTEKMLTLYERVEKPLINVLADMENAGIIVDAAQLKTMSGSFAREAEQLEKEIFALADCEFNIGSPKQLGEVLFEKLGLDGGKKSKKTGAYSTDARVLETLADEGHAIAQKVVDWRHLTKLKNTYIDSLPKQIARDGRVHTTFEMAVASTGRLSSQNPNLQNIPIRTENGNKIREAFVAAPGCKLISADYSQIELRLLAHIADIPILQDAFRRNLDIHAATASQMFGVELAAVDSELRRKAKMINFGIIYGMSAFGLAQRLGIGREEAALYIKQYFAQYPGIEAYMKTTVEFARKHQYVQTLWGRKCFVSGINDKNGGIRQFSERAAINAPLQGAAADIIKKAMVSLASQLTERNFKAKMLLQVHDELVIEAPEAEAEAVAALLRQVMEHVVELSVPTPVDVRVGNNWREIH